MARSSALVLLLFSFSSLSGMKAAALPALPLRFEVNAGQADPAIQFMARSSAGSVLLRSHGLVLKARAARPIVLDLAGRIAPAAPEALKPLASRSNYFLGRDPAKWRRDVPNFGRVRYKHVWPGIDLVYYGSGNRLDAGTDAQVRQAREGSLRRARLGELSLARGKPSTGGLQFGRAQCDHTVEVGVQGYAWSQVLARLVEEWAEPALHLRPGACCLFEVGLDRRQGVCREVALRLASLGLRGNGYGGEGPPSDRPPVPVAAAPRRGVSGCSPGRPHPVSAQEAAVQAGPVA